MARPVGATHQLVGSVQTALDGLDLLCIADVANGQTDGQSFVAGLRADLADLEVTLADGITPVPWRLPDESCFSQTSGAEKLLLICKIPTADVKVWRGCQQPLGPSAGPGVLPSTARTYAPLGEETGAMADWKGNHPLTRYNSLLARTDGILSYGQACNGTDFAYNAAFTTPAATNLTCSFWVRPSTLNYQRWFSRGGWSRLPAFTLEPSKSRIHWGYYWHVYSPWLPTVGEWTHMAYTLTIDPGGNHVENLYVDGVFKATATTTSDLSGPMPMTLGNDMWDTPRPDEILLGDIDEFLWLDEAWDATQIGQYYQMVSAPEAWTTWDGPEESLGAEPAVGVYRPWLMTGGRMR